MVICIGLCTLLSSGRHGDDRPCAQTVCSSGYEVVAYATAVILCEVTAIVRIPWEGGGQVDPFEIGLKR